MNRNKGAIFLGGFLFSLEMIGLVWFLSRFSGSKLKNEVSQAACHAGVFAGTKGGERAEEHQCLCRVT